MILQILISYLLLSCTNITRDKPEDNKDLTGRDYRLFQNTPAWELAKAVQDENVSRITDIIAKDNKIANYQEPKYGNTLLILTIKNQQFRSFKALLKNKTDVSIHNTFDGTSALIEACGSKHYDIKYAEILLQNGANANDVETGDRKDGNSTRETPLIAASKTGKLDLVILLLKNGADLNYQNEYNQSALSECVKVGKYQIAIYLLQKGSDYKRPIFYRPDYSIPAEKRDTNDKGKPMFLADVLREVVLDFDSDEYKYKMQIVDFLKDKGIDYRATPIPEYIKKKAQENYPQNWQEYLEKY